MKLKLLSLIAISLMLFSCQKEDAESVKTTYRVINNGDVYSSPSDPYLTGALWDVIVFCYIGEDLARQDNLEPINPGGRSKIMEVEDEFTKVKVSFMMLPEESEFYDRSSNYRKYVYTYSFLKKGENIDIIIDGETMISGDINAMTSGKTGDPSTFQHSPPDLP